MGMLAEKLGNQQAHDQSQSPLFSDIPPEIRTIIFRCALLAYYDKSRPFPNDAYHHRPDFLYDDRIDTALLQTCRQIYLETYRLPIALNDHVFWCSPSRGPPSRSEESPVDFFESLLDEQVESVNRVHLFTQLFWLEGRDFESLSQHPKFRPRSLHITIRHSDWWFWEDNNLLALSTGWMSCLMDVRGLEELVLEMETIDRDKNQVWMDGGICSALASVSDPRLSQMYAIAERVGKLKVDLHDNRALQPLEAPARGQWMGPSAYREVHYMRHYDSGWWRYVSRTEPPTLYPPMVYQTIKLRWYATSSGKSRVVA
ncbi:hypothetical protein AAF712_004222 [Marasmius tenuissimus]|uniref:Uncharacterized protein n=1 Tax=Marasmius tenuissimus TaxID=585030 RepID=A0ABR3A550_9AGAR